MSAERFSLLPARYAERVAERRWARLVAGALVAVFAVLALAGLSQSRALRQAEKERDVEQARTAALVARRGELVRFRQLAEGIVARERLLAAAMGTEVSWAGVLASLARSFPEGASLTSLTAESKLPPLGTMAPKAGNERSVIGSAALKGYSVDKFTPGVERVLQVLVTVEGLSEPRLQLGATTEIGKQRVTSFEGSAFVDTRALTGRYVEGLPPEDDVEVPVLGGGSTPGSPAGAGPPK